jgi:hypothetical protein
MTNYWDPEWRNYRGGQNRPIWIVNLASHDLETPPWTDSRDIDPAWLGETVYFLSDRDWLMNVWAYDTRSKQLTQITRFTDYDVKSLDGGGGALVFEQGGRIHLLDPRTGRHLDQTLLAPVPHRQVVLTLPKRLRAYCLYRRALLGDLARVAARIVTAAVRATTGEPDLRVGIVACLQTHGSLANWHPHLHLVVTDGGFRPDGTFVRWPGWPGHDTALLTEAFRRAVLRLFVRRGLFDEDQAQGMLQWPHSGFQVHTGVGVPEDDRAFALRLARYCARAPVALERMSYEAERERVTYRSDKAAGPTAGTETVDPLEFLARVVTHIPDPGQVMQRYYGWYASRTRGTRRRQASDAAGAPVPIADPEDWSLRAARYRWAELLRRIFEVDPLACPWCRGPMRMLAVITDPAVITRILAQRARHRDPAHRSRSPPPRRRRSPTKTAASSPHP